MKKYILLADDDADDRQLFKEALTQINNQLHCYVVTNGKECISFLEEAGNYPAIIFSDMNMPLMNGKQLLLHLKDSVLFKDIPVIMMSTEGGAKIREELISLGAEDYIVKPGCLQELKCRIHAAYISVLQRLSQIPRI